MKLIETSEGDLLFESIPMPVGGMIRLLLDRPEPGDRAQEVEERLFPAPSEDPELIELVSDWKAFVEPDLHEHFEVCTGEVRSDIRAMVFEAHEYTLRIPKAHIEAWLTTLNRVRLSLATVYDFEEEELESLELPDLSKPRGQAAFQMNLYAFMQQVILEAMDPAFGFYEDSEGDQGEEGDRDGGSGFRAVDTEEGPEDPGGSEGSEGEER